MSAIKRVYEPGCQVRQLPVLRGPQDLGKGKLGESIFSTQWFGTDGLSTKLNHDDVASMTRFWCFELGELDGYRKHQVPKLKNFISQSSSYCRFVYMRSHQMIQRRTVFWGTSNGIPLNDPTGSTRFVVIPVETDLPWRDVAIAREPLLACTLQEYRDGVRSYSTADEMAAIQERNSDHQLTEPWFNAIYRNAELIMLVGRLPVTTDGLYNAVGLTEIRPASKPPSRAHSQCHDSDWLCSKPQSHWQREQTTRLVVFCAASNDRGGTGFRGTPVVVERACSDAQR